MTDLTAGTPRGGTVALLAVLLVGPFMAQADVTKMWRFAGPPAGSRCRPRGSVAGAHRLRRVRAYSAPEHEPLRARGSRQWPKAATWRLTTQRLGPS